MKIGIIGCGAISDVYFKAGKIFDVFQIAACADLVLDRAREKAAGYGCRACTVDELLADPEIRMVVNLTVPQAHAEVALKALNAGKHVYNEKPLAVRREDARQILDFARQRQLRVGCAPDTFLGGGIQTALKLINDGWIGRPLAATAFVMHRLPKTVPAFLYQTGGGPMFDLGPYYLTTLIAFLGPVRRVAGITCIPFSRREAAPEGRLVDVETPTTLVGIMDFACGAVGTIATSFDVCRHSLPRIEVYGSEGTLSVPDPNTFGGPVRIVRAGSDEMKDIPLTHGYAEQSRGLGVADMAYGINSGRGHRANGELAYHVLDIMHAFHESSVVHRHVELESACEKPRPLPLGLEHGILDL